MQLLAGQGYWVLLVNPRGSSGYGHDFTFATRGRWGMADYQDLMKAVDVAIARGGVDTTRLGVAGGSLWGFLTHLGGGGHPPLGAPRNGPVTSTRDRWSGPPAPPGPPRP